jgi:chromosome segregation ATPase
MGELEKLRDEVAALRARIAELEAALEACRSESRQRWEAIGRLAPAAKRLRAERDELRRKLVLSGGADSD